MMTISEDSILENYTKDTVNKKALREFILEELKFEIGTYYNFEIGQLHFFIDTNGEKIKCKIIEIVTDGLIIETVNNEGDTDVNSFTREITLHDLHSINGSGSYLTVNFNKGD